MSKFKTSIPVDVEAVKRLLPEGAFFHGIEWDADSKTVNVLWEHDDFTSGRDFALDFPVENLTQRQLPDGVSKPLPVATSAPVADPNLKPPEGAKLIELPKAPVTEQDIERSLAEGTQAVEAAKERATTIAPASNPIDLAAAGLPTESEAPAPSSALPASDPPVRTEAEKTVEKKRGRK